MKRLVTVASLMLLAACQSEQRSQAVPADTTAPRPTGITPDTTQAPGDSGTGTRPDTARKSTT